MSNTSTRKNNGFTPATPARPKLIVSMPPKNAAIAVNSPRISAAPIRVSPMAMTGAKNPAPVRGLGSLGPRSAAPGQLAFNRFRLPDHVLYPAWQVMRSCVCEWLPRVLPVAPPWLWKLPWPHRPGLWLSLNLDVNVARYSVTLFTAQGDPMLADRKSLSRQKLSRAEVSTYA